MYSDRLPEVLNFLSFSVKQETKEKSDCKSIA